MLNKTKQKQEYQQTFKLQMYKQLAMTVAIFVALFGLLTVLVLAQRGGAMDWPWQWVWVQSVMWEVLNFGILAAVCIIWRPSDNAKYLSYSSQVNVLRAFSFIHSTVWIHE